MAEGERAEACAYDVIVVGGGVVGSSAAAAAAARGASVLLLDQYEVGHERGSSHGDGRIFRVAYDEEDYVQLGRVALDGWRALERAVGEPLLHTTGGVTVADSDQLDTLDQLEASLEKFGLAHERLRPAEAAQRFPQFRLSEGQEAVYQPDSGVLRATKCVVALWGRVEALGARTVTGERMKQVEQADRGGVLVRMESGRTFRGRSAILALGAWAGKLLGLPISVTEETVGYYPPRAPSPAGGPSPPPPTPEHTHAAMPVFIVRTRHGLGEPDVGFYGLPQVDIPGVKVAAHHVGPPVDPDIRPGDPRRRQQCIDATSAFVERFLPHLDPRPCHSLTCLYSVTNDHDFIIERHPTIPDVILAAGFSGHGFKFGPALGDLLSAMAMGLPCDLPSERFRLAKPGGRGLGYK